MTYLKNFDGTKALNAKQCSEGISPKIIPFLPKMSLPVLPSPESLWEILRMGENPTQQSKISSFPQQKNRPYRFTSSAIKSVIPFPIK